MPKKLIKLDKTHCHKLAELFKSQLSINDRSYYANFYRLDDLIDNFKDEVSDNCFILGLENKREYYNSLLQKFRSISIVYDQKILEEKLKKYNESKSSFPEFTNETLNKLLNKVPSKPVEEYLQEDLARHSLTTQAQTAFFKYWMNLQKENLETWLESLLDGEEGSDPRSTKEGLTLAQEILVGTLDGTLTAAENFYGINLATRLSHNWSRPRNKIAAILKKLYNLSGEWMKTAAYQRDFKIAEEYVARYRDDQ